MQEVMVFQTNLGGGSGYGIKQKDKNIQEVESETSNNELKEEDL